MGPGPLALQIGALLLGDPYPTRTRIEVAPEILESYAGTYQIEGQGTRQVFAQDGKLFTQRGGGLRLEAIPFSETGFFYERSMTHFKIVFDDSGQVSHMLMYHDGADEAERADLTDEEIVVPHERTAIHIDPSIYDRYIGTYELAPGFNLTVTRSDDRLLTQATGQAQVEVYPSSETEFFLTVVDAQLTFEIDEEGRAVAVTLHQGGRDVRGPRIAD